MRKKALGSQEIGLNGVRNYRPSMFSLSSPLPLGSSVSNQLKLLKALGFCHILGGKSCPMPDRGLGPAPEPRGPERGEKPLCLCSRPPPFPQLLFLTGLPLIIGLRKTFSFFFQRHKLKGTSFFLGGVVIVLLRWPLLGMFLETYGFFSLFK